MTYEGSPSQGTESQAGPKGPKTAGQEAQERQEAQQDQAVQNIQDFLEAQVGQTVLEDKVAVHHPLPRLTERAPRESRREHHPTQPSTLCSRN